MTSSNAHDRLEIPLYFVKTDLTVFKHNLKYQIQVICKIEGSPQSKKEGPKSLPKELMHMVLSLLPLVVLAEIKNYRGKSCKGIDYEETGAKL